MKSDFVSKFVACGADIGILDLEDATPPEMKASARKSLIELPSIGVELGHMKLLVRTNSIGSSHFAEDIAAARSAGVDGIVVPKLETDREVDDVRQAMASAGLKGALLCGGIESGAGVHRAVEVCGAGIDLVYFGAEDYITDIGGRRTRSNEEVLFARSQVALAARLANVPALDQIVVDYGDAERFTSEANQARNLGYSGKLCIHPSQVPLANQVFMPSAEELDWARGLLAAADAGATAGRGVVSYEGTMVDAPIIARARRIVEQAQA